MEEAEINALKYPVGKVKFPETYNRQYILQCIKELQEFPAAIKHETAGLDESSLAYLHRPGGWTIRQIVHHCADSHMNAFIRIKLALTEDKPVIKPYKEAEWAKLPDVVNAPVEWSLQVLEGMHNRFVVLLSAIDDAGFQQTYFHPESGKEVKMVELLFIYSWHCGHHLAHIRNAKKYKNKF